MSELLDIIISAVDQASDVFQSITGNATDMGSQITDSIENSEQDFEDMAESAESAAESVGNVGDAADSVDGSGIQSVAGDADGLEQEVLEADDAINQMNSDLGIINSSMMLQLGEQVGQLGTNAESMAQEMNTAAISVGQLATQTGIAEPEMINLINTISNATFPNDEAMMYVQALDQMGVSASNFGKSATDMDRINDAFGLGAPNVRALSNELSVLGVDMNNVSSSFNALAYANSNTIGGMENYQKFLTRYSSDFADLGLNIDQASVVIAAATQKWGGGRKAVGELSSVLQECGDDVGALEEALGLESGALENATDTTGEYEGQLLQLASEEAEHKTLLDQIGAAWEDLSLSLSPVLAPLGSAVGLIGSIGSFGLQVGGLKTLGSTLKGAAVSMGLLTAAEEAEAVAAGEATVANEGLAVAEGLALWPILAIIAAIAALVVVVYEVGKAFGWWTDVNSMLEAISAGVTRLWNAFVNHPDVQAAIQGLTDLWNWLSSSIVAAGQAVMDFLGINQEGSFDVVAVIIQTVGNAWNFLKGIVDAVVGVVRQVISGFQQVIGVLSNVANVIMSVAGPYINQIIGFINGLINTINQFRDGQIDLPTFILSILTQLWNAYWSIYSKIIQLVIKFGSQLLSYAIRAGKNFVKGIMDKLKQLPGKAYSALMDVVSKIVSAGAAWVSHIKQQASNVVTKAVGILKSLPGKISSALSGVVSALTSPFKSAWDTIKPIFDNIKGAIDTVSGALGFGGETAYGGETAVDMTTGNLFNVSNGSYTVRNEPIEINQNITLDLANVPSHIDTATLIRAMQDKDVLRALTSNPDFQSLDNQVKTRLNLKVARSRGR